MARYKCIVPCYYQTRLWTAGEILSSLPGEVVPQHFVKVTEKKTSAPVAPAVDASTFAQVQKEEAEAVLAAVGHSKKTQKVAKVKDKVLTEGEATAEEVVELTNKNEKSEDSGADVSGNLDELFI